MRPDSKRGHRLAIDERTMSSHWVGTPASSRWWNSGTTWRSSTLKVLTASMASRWAGSDCHSAEAMAQPTVASWHSSHQPSSTEQFSPPLNTDFIPLVPHASMGRTGVLSHTSHPSTSMRATEMS